MARRWPIAAILLFALVTWLAFAHRAPVPDVSWLSEGARRWLGGQQLYVDVREINPPLVFYELVLLSLGTLRNAWLVAGIVLASVASSLWVARHHGARLGLGTFVAITAAGLIEFGQREHLLLVFVIPYLLARGGTAERAAMGAWAFLGVGLKPYFLPIVALPALVEAWRNPRSLFAAQKLALGACLAAYLAHTYLTYPAYFSDIVPLARQTYTYGSPMPPFLIIETLLAGAVLFLCGRNNLPLAAALVGALISFFLQQRYWPYHFIAAAGFSILLAWVANRTSLLIGTIALQFLQGPYPRQPHPPLPDNIRRVLILSAHPRDAYPGVPACGAVNASPGGSIGWMPGPWAALGDPKASPAERAQAEATLKAERARLLHDIEAQKVELIIADANPRKAYFTRPVDYARFIGPPPGFRLVKRVGHFDYWARVPLSPRNCVEKF